MEDARKDLFWTIFFLIAIAVVWYYTGGPSRPESKSGIFLDKPREQRAEEVRSATEKTTSSSLVVESAYKYKIILNAGAGAKESLPQKEYIEMRASYNNTETYNITGWSLESKEKRTKTIIDKAADLPFLSQINYQNDIFLPPGERTIIVTGESPLGVSFKINNCTGYFSQFQNFFPPLMAECPLFSRSEVSSLADGDACFDYINKNLSSCATPLNLPSYLSDSCRNYINQKINYTGCVNDHRNDTNFYKPEWRIYLNQKNELWGNEHDTIILRDKQDKIIDWVSY